MNEEFAAISIPELRRRVDSAVAQLRQMRYALAVHTGMTLEDAPTQTIPELDSDAGRIALEQMLASLPLLRKPLTPEQRAQLHPVSPAQHEQMKTVFDEVIANKEVYEKLMEGAEQPIPFERMVELREGFDKMEMIGEFERELTAYLEEVRAYREILQERIEAATEGMTSDKKDISN